MEIQLDLFSEAVHLESVDPSRNRARFYSMAVGPDLFGEWVLFRAWGRIGTQGREALQAFPSASFAIDAMTDVVRKKARRGYRSHGGER